MKNRIKQVRQHPSVNLSQDAFGRMLGVTGAAISRIESGARNISEQIILGVCKTFGVNEEWLRTGEGPMFLKEENSAIAEIAAKYHLSEADKVLFEIYLKSSEDERRVLMRYAFSLAGKILEDPALYREYKCAQGDLSSPPPLTPPEWSASSTLVQPPLASVPTPPTPETDVATELAALQQQNAELLRQNAEMMRRMDSLEESAAESERLLGLSETECLARQPTGDGSP